MTELLNRIRQEQESFPAAQKLVAAYVLENYNQIPFLSISTLAKNIGVSDNTVVKFCIQLGYNKFTEFKKVFSDYAHSELVMFNKISESTEHDDDEGFFAQQIDEDVAAIRATLADVTNRENLPKLLEMMDKSKRIYITGGRSSGVLASLFANMLRYLGLKVYDVSFGVGDYLDRLSMVEKDDLVIVISFPRYTSLVVEAMRDLHEAGIPIALITDTGLSPAHPYSDISFHCTISSSYYFPNYTSCLSLFGVISRAAAATRKKRAAQHICQLEGWLLERGIFM
ncbi:MAG: MurR/RpiR family transcriptional regulator [Candidatus Fimivivens sp.]